MTKIINILKEIRPDIDIESKSFIDDGILDSFDIVTLVGELVNEFSIKIKVEDIVPENFNSLDAIVTLINKKA